MNSFVKWLGNRFHNHQWEIHQEAPLVVHHAFMPDVIVEKGLRYVLRCKICGEIRQKDIR